MISVSKENIPSKPYRIFVLRFIAFCNFSLCETGCLEDRSFWFRYRIYFMISVSKENIQLQKCPVVLNLNIISALLYTGVILVYAVVRHKWFLHTQA